MNDFGATLDREIGEPPTSTVDVDAVIARERLRGRLRRGGAIASATVAVAGIVVGTVALVGVSAPSGPVPGAPGGVATAPPRQPGCPPLAHPSPTPSRSPWITAEPSPTASPPGSNPVLPAGAGPRLTGALKAAVRAAVGRPTLGASQWGGLRRPLEFNAGPCDRQTPGDYFAAASVLTTTRPSIRLGDVFVQVTAVSSGPGPGFPTRCTTPVENQTACTASRGPHGETVVAVTWHGDRQGTPAATWHDVTITKPDGTVVTLHSGGAGPAHPTPPVTAAQLIKIGLDPLLTLG